jgi:DNA polymerase III subunit epsilon
MREIVLDTETTGLDPGSGHRMVEIGCVELVNSFRTGKTFHKYLNPERDVPAEAHAVHGLTAEFLKDKAYFHEIIDDLIAFIGDAPLVAHNAMFDFGFLNAELERCGRPILARDRLVDTLLLARRKHPAGPNSLDHLCLRYGIDNTQRTKHGALLDAELLGEVYVELLGKRQGSLGLSDIGSVNGRSAVITVQVRAIPLTPRISAAEEAAHRAFVASLGSQPIWLDYLPVATDVDLQPDSDPAELNVVVPITAASTSGLGAGL